MSAREPYDDRTFFEKYGIGLIVGLIGLVIAGVGLGLYLFAGKVPPPKQPQEIMVKLLPPPLPPPPPPPPPPPKIPPPPQQKMVEIKPQDKAPPKPEAKNDKPAAAPGPKASGPPSDDGIGGGGGGGGDSIGGVGGTVFGYYAAQVSDQVRAALSRNGRTRVASFRVKVRVWSDASGRVTRATLGSSTGDPALDAAIRDEVLTGLQLQEPPPQGMPMPIVMMLHEVRPG